MELVKVTNSSLVVKYNGHFQAIILLHLSEAFVTVDCFLKTSSLWLLWLLSYILFFSCSHSLSLSHLSCFFSVSPTSHSEHSTWAVPSCLWLQPPSLLWHFPTHLSFPYCCLSTRPIYPTTSWSYFWLFLSDLHFSFLQNWTPLFTSISCIFYLRKKSVICSAF